jgi:Regulator of chromosome condensation (RCC1) repeat/BTB/POZ domain/Ankyrin repeat
MRKKNKNKKINSSKMVLEIVIAISEGDLLTVERWAADGRNAKHIVRRLKGSVTLVHVAAAAAESSARMLEALLSNPRLSRKESILLCKDRYGRTPLHVAARRGRLDSMMVLLRLCAASASVREQALHYVNDVCAVSPVRMLFRYFQQFGRQFSVSMGADRIDIRANVESQSQIDIDDDDDDEYDDEYSELVRTAAPSSSSSSSLSTAATAPSLPVSSDLELSNPFESANSSLLSSNWRSDENEKRRERVAHAQWSRLAREDGVRRVATFGDNSNFALGTENAGKRRKAHPASIRLDSLAKSDQVAGVSTSLHGSAAWTQRGAVYAWGMQRDGLLGLGTQCGAHVLAPTRIAALARRRVVHVSMSLLHAGFVTDDGELYMCGDARHGKLGCAVGGGERRRRRVAEPERANLSARVVQVSCGRHHTLALTQCGRVYAFGRNNAGQLGVGSDTATFESPQQLASLASFNAVMVAGGADFSAVAIGTGDVYFAGCGQSALKRVKFDFGFPGLAARDGRFQIGSMAADRFLMLCTVGGECYTAEPSERVGCQPRRVNVGRRRALRCATDANRGAIVLLPDLCVMLCEDMATLHSAPTATADALLAGHHIFRRRVVDIALSQRHTACIALGDRSCCKQVPPPSSLAADLQSMFDELNVSSSSSFASSSFALPAASAGTVAFACADRVNVLAHLFVLRSRCGSAIDEWPERIEVDAPSSIVRQLLGCVYTADASSLPSISGGGALLKRLHECAGGAANKVALRIVGDGDLSLSVERDTKTLSVHRAMLVRRTEFFRGLLASAFAESRQSSVSLDISTPLAHALVHYIYTDKLCSLRMARDRELRERLELYSLACQLLIDDLAALVLAQIGRLLHTADVLDVVDVALQLDSAPLLELCIDFAHANVDHLLAAHAFFDDSASSQAIELIQRAVASRSTRAHFINDLLVNLASRSKEEEEGKEEEEEEEQEEQEVAVEEVIVEEKAVQVDEKEEEKTMVEEKKEAAKPWRGRSAIARGQATTRRTKSLAAIQAEEARMRKQSKNDYASRAAASSGARFGSNSGDGQQQQQQQRGWRTTSWPHKNGGGRGNRARQRTVPMAVPHSPQAKALPSTAGWATVSGRGKPSLSKRQQRQRRAAGRGRSTLERIAYEQAAESRSDDNLSQSPTLQDIMQLEEAKRRQEQEDHRLALQLAQQWEFFGD